MVDLALEKLRTEIDEVDSEMIALLRRRQAILTTIRTYKKRHHLNGYDSARETRQHLARRHESQYVQACMTSIVTNSRDYVLDQRLRF